LLPIQRNGVTDVATDAPPGRASLQGEIGRDALWAPLN
jgi:hypothetical protein